MQPDRPQSEQNPTPLLTIDAVAKLLGVSRDWVRDHSTRRNPRIPVVRLGGRRALLRYRRCDIDQFISENLISPESTGRKGIQ
jgi:predicted DNA-binding transcriptional regulator AlpA